MDNTINTIFQLYLKFYNLIKIFKNIHSIHHIDALGLLPRPQLNNNSTNKNEMITSACAKLPLVVHVRPGVKKSSASSSSTWVRIVFTKSTGYWKSWLYLEEYLIILDVWWWITEKDMIFCTWVMDSNSWTGLLSTMWVPVNSVIVSSLRR